MAIRESSVRRACRVLAAALMAGVAGFLVPASVGAAANTLSNGLVVPATGTVATPFAFSVQYTSDQGFAAGSVWADVAGATVTLALVSGSADDGTFAGSSTLPAGTWLVTFLADAVQGNDPTLVGPTLTVIDPTATPTPSPSPTAAPTPPPSPPPAPTPKPPRTPRPTTAPTSRPTSSPTSLPVASPPTLPPGGLVAPGPTTAQASVPAGAPSADPSGRSSSTPVASGVPAPATGRVTDEPDPAADETTTSGSPWLFVGGGMSAIGAAILAGNWVRWRRKRPAGP